MTIKSIWLYGKVFTPDRTLPWAEDEFAFVPPGGIEPGETVELIAHSHELGEVYFSEDPTRGEPRVLSVHAVDAEFVDSQATTSQPPKSLPAADEVVPATRESSTAVAQEKPKQQQPTVDQRGFRYKNVTVEPASGDLKLTGEVTNTSGVDYSLASFIVTLYDRSGKLLKSTPAIVNNLMDGQTKPIEVTFTGLSTDRLGRYQIRFESGL